ncbi:hypothetical protein QUF80_12775 [Desulfococcaceae bacterium HSG8]|nr:hypothetical protein [Desulfococcaceae bacterium HSG8]
MIENQVAVSGTKAVGLGAKTVGTLQTVLLSSAFGVVALAGLIGYELWKGNKDSQELEVQKA